jgi:hypothetical protein
MICRIKCRKCGLFFDLDEMSLSEHGKVCQTSISIPAGMLLGEAADRHEHEVQVDRQIDSLDAISKQDVTPAMVNSLSDAQVKELLQSLIRAGRTARSANSRLIKLMRLGQQERKRKIKESWKTDPDDNAGREKLRMITREMIKEQLLRQKQLIGIDMNLRKRYFEVGTWQVTRAVSKETGVNLQELYARLPKPMNAHQDPHSIWRNRVRAVSSPSRRAWALAHATKIPESNNPQDAMTEHGRSSHMDCSKRAHAKLTQPKAEGASPTRSTRPPSPLNFSEDERERTALGSRGIWEFDRATANISEV